MPKGTMKVLSEDDLYDAFIEGFEFCMSNSEAGYDGNILVPDYMTVTEEANAYAKRINLDFCPPNEG